MSEEDISSFRSFLSIRNAYSGTMSPDGSRLAFLTDITGTGQIWTLDGAEQWPDQRTFYDERVTFVQYNPRRGLLAFGRDAGGNELDQLYVMDDDGQLVRRLTHSPEHKHMFGGWSPDGTAIAYSANTRHPAHFDLHLVAVQRGEQKLIYEGSGWNYVAAWLHDGRHLITGHLHSNMDNDLYLFDLKTGERTHLTSHTGDARYLQVCPLPDSSGFYLLADEDREFRSLAFYDLSTRTLRYLDDGAYEWDREALALSEDGRWLAMLSNEGGWSVLELRDLYEERCYAVEALPGGVAGGLSIPPTNDHCVLTHTGPRDPMDIWVVDFDTRSPRRWTRSARAGIPRETLTEPEAVHFHSFDGIKIPALYYRPKNGDASLPVVIDVHGGPESQRRPNFSAVTQYLVQHGYAVLAPNVRGSTGYGRTYTHLDDVEKRMDSVADLRSAYEWLVEHGDADSRRIGLMGGSYGGFMVLAGLTTYPDLWAAGVDIVGIANFVTFLENTGPWRRKVREREYGSLDGDRAFLKSISPINRVDKIQAPLMVVHGANDPRVPLGEAEQIVAALQERDVPVEFLVYDDEGHGLAKLSNRLDAYPKIVRFLDKYLK